MLKRFIRGLAFGIRSQNPVNNTATRPAPTERSPAHAPSQPVIEPLEGRCLLNATHAAPAAPSNLSATVYSASRIDLWWNDNSSSETGFQIHTRTSASRKWSLLAVAPANSTHRHVTALAPRRNYQFRVRAIGAAGKSVYTNSVLAKTLKNPTSAASPIHVPATGYAAPIVITRGGTYSGNWQSLDPYVPAVSVRTSQPVIIENANIRSRGTLIDVSDAAANLTVRNTRGYGLNPNVRGLYPGRFLKVQGFANILVEGNYMEGTSGIYLDTYLGNHSSSQTVRALRNQARNIDGRYSDGNGGFLNGPDDNFYVQFFQINGVHGLTAAEVAWNEVINEAGKSRVEDNISIHNTSGTPASPFLIHNNYIQGAYPADYAGDNSFTGGGIMLSDNGSAFVRAYANQVISTSNYGIAISSGHDNEFFNNRIVSCGALPNGALIATHNVGAYIWNQNGESTFTNNVGHDNLVGWSQRQVRNDWWVPDAAAWTRNKSLPANITASTETGEWTLWNTKLAQAGVKIGPITP